MHDFERIFQCFPTGITHQIQTLNPWTKRDIEEIRVYKNKEMQIFAAGKRISLQDRVQGNDMIQILNNLMRFSYHTYEEDLAKGFITIEGGHRVGICGKAVVEKGKVILLKEISSFNIRRAKEVIGCSDLLMPHVIEKGKINNILIASPPGCGKTTLIRDIARNLTIQHYKVAICDERSEIAGMHGGISSYHFGAMLDVLDGCPKAEGMMMLVRSMSPDVIITDEIGRDEDLYAIKTCINCGVSLITTIHGSNEEDLKRSAIYPCIEDGIFHKLVFLTDKPVPGTIREVVDV